jgi:signal transduction histidine kinase
MKRWIRPALEIVALAAIISLVLLGIVVSFSGRWNWGWAKWGLLHGITIGGIAHPVLSYAAPVYWRYGRLLRWALVVVTLIAVAFAGCVVAVAIIGWLGIPTNQGTYWSRVFWAFRGASIITLVVGIIGTITESYQHRLRRTTVELQEKERERERLERLAGEAQLASIESRIQPHFLFNTLNSISSLIREEPDKAERLIERLSALLRSSLDTHQVPLVPLRQELKLVTDYLEIQRARFGERLRYSISCPSELENWGVPPFSVQTLVENSLKYAVAPRREGGRVDVAAFAEDGRLSIRVEDDGPGFDAATLPAGHGLDNLQSRLMAMFGSAAALGVLRKPNGFTASFTLPQREADAIPST